MSNAVANRKPRARKGSRPRGEPARLLLQGNTKLGRDIWTWSIPAIETCPGATASCTLACYATRGFFTWDVQRARYAWNHRRSRDADFAAAMIAEIRCFRPRIVRIHVAGDFESAAYADKWLRIVRRCPKTTFFAYTRSWRVPEIVPALRALAKTPNMFLWLSLDKDTGEPPDIPGTRTAFMLECPEDEHLVPPDCDLVFRTHDKPPRKRVGRTLICPWEQGIIGKSGRIGCGRCGICYS